jgi:hypothetical protein
MSKLIIVLVACCIGLAAAQTFQYSRGWTNGKRSGQTANDNVVLPSLRQMTNNPLLMTANELNNRERYQPSLEPFIIIFHCGFPLLSFSDCCSTSSRIRATCERLCCRVTTSSCQTKTIPRHLPPSCWKTTPRLIASNGNWISTIKRRARTTVYKVPS